MLQLLLRLVVREQRLPLLADVRGVAGIAKLCGVVSLIISDRPFPSVHGFFKRIDILLKWFAL